MCIGVSNDIGFKFNNMESNNNGVYKPRDFILVKSVNVNKMNLYHMKKWRFTQFFPDFPFFPIFPRRNGKVGEKIMKFFPFFPFFLLFPYFYDGGGHNVSEAPRD